MTLTIYCDCMTTQHAVRTRDLNPREQVFVGESLLQRHPFPADAGEYTDSNYSVSTSFCRYSSNLV